MVQHYFVSTWILADGVSRDLFMRKVDNNLYAAGMIAPLESIAPGASKSIEAKLFIGPQEEKVLEALAPGLELVKDYGWLTILAKPLYWLLDKLHSFILNWGWAIVALVLLLKIAFYWLNAKAYASMAKMKKINPRIMEMRERLKDKPQEMQQQMMKIYKEEKVNPMGGCFPIMVQIPVFIALYWVLLSSVEMRGAPWVLWINDLSAPDTLFGTIPGIDMPFGLLPIIMTLTTMLQTALNPAPPDPLQAKLMWFMPLIFSVMFFFFPAGLVLYWITNNVLSIAQQWVINTRMGVPPQFNLPSFK
jgi:YidC/Oxa1 family membrane protein insertase